MISTSAVDLVSDLEEIAAIGGKRDAEHGVGATVGAGGSDDPPVGSGDRENRPGPRIDLSGEHPDRESLSPLGVDEKAIDIAGRIEGAVDDPRQRDGGRLVIRPIGLRPRQHREGIDEERFPRRQAVASEHADAVRSGRNVGGDRDIELVFHRPRPIAVGRAIEGAGLRQMRLRRDSRMREPQLGKVVEIDAVKRHRERRAGRATGRENRIQTSRRQLCRGRLAREHDGKDGKDGDDNADNTRHKKSWPVVRQKATRPREYKTHFSSPSHGPAAGNNGHHTNWNSLALSTAQRMSSQACWRLSAPSTCPRTMPRSAAVGWRAKARR